MVNLTLTPTEALALRDIGKFYSNSNSIFKWNFPDPFWYRAFTDYFHNNHHINV